MFVKNFNFNFNKKGFGKLEPLKNYKNIPSQRELANILGITEAYVSMLLSGKRRNPDMLSKLKELIKKHLKAA